MKKIVMIFAASLTSFFLFCQEVSELHKKFIKGNIAEKTSAVTAASGEDAETLSLKAVDFVIENRPLLGADRDLSALAVASILALPKDFKDESDSSFWGNKLLAVFDLFEDDTVRISVLDRLSSSQSETYHDFAVTLANNYLKTLPDDKTNSPVTEKAIVSLGNIGNSDSFKIIYDGWICDKWQTFNNEAEAAIKKLSSQSLPDVIKAISEADTSTLNKYFSLIKNNSEITNSFKAEIAENALSAAIHNTEDFSENMADAVAVQLDALQIISENNWTRAARLADRFFPLAKEEYKTGVMSEEQFINVINYIADLSSAESAATFSDYLAELNKNAEKNIFAAESVMLAVIKSLGEMGNKSAFDNLLYVTYLDYSDDVKNKAREALSKLKW